MQYEDFLVLSNNFNQEAEDNTKQAVKCYVVHLLKSCEKTLICPVQLGDPTLSTIAKSTASKVLHPLKKNK